LTETCGDNGCDEDGEDEDDDDGGGRIISLIVVGRRGLLCGPGFPAMGPLPKQTFAHPSKQQRASSRQSRSGTPTLQQFDCRPAHEDIGGNDVTGGHVVCDGDGGGDMEGDCDTCLNGGLFTGATGAI